MIAALILCKPLITCTKWIAAIILHHGMHYPVKSNENEN
jgi:hypothetical protein